jgi:minor extracellular serine protease Vpr
MMLTINFWEILTFFHRGANVEFFQATSAGREILIDISGATGVFKIILEAKTVNGSGSFIATLNPAAYFGANAFLNYIAPQGRIHDYASALNVISPADYVVDNTWTDINGVPSGKTNQESPGEIWIGSSEGPTQDGRLGIDFAAPGEACIGAYSMDSYYGNFAFNNIENGNGFYGIQNAVSASAPVTIGVIALMLEANPSLTHQGIKFILQSTAIADNFTQAVPNNTWGFGKLNALEAIRTSLRKSSDIIISEDAIEISERTNAIKYLVRGNFQNYDVMLLDPLGNIITDYSNHSENVLEIDLSGIPSG